MGWLYVGFGVGALGGLITLGLARDFWRDEKKISPALIVSTILLLALAIICMARLIDWYWLQTAL